MSLQVLVNGFDVTNGVTHRINWTETTGLFDPSSLVEPEMVDTFEGPYRVRQTTTDYGMREIEIVGSLYTTSSTYADKLRALDNLQSIYAPRPSRVVVGTLELQVDFGRVEVQSDEMKRLNAMIRYKVRGTAIPATFACVYGAGTGLTQGIPVDTQRVNEAATLATMASGVGTITCLGDVPTPAVLTIQNNPAAVKVYYLATSATGRRVPISTDANGVGRIDERAGLYLAPGVNRITAYQAATGTATFTDITVMSFFGTTWRYSGNAVAGNATRFDLGPALTVNRTGSARYFRGNTNPVSGGTDGIVTAGDDEPRIGWVWQNRRNLIVNSLDLRASWTDFSLTVRQSGMPDAFGYEGGGRAGLTASDTTTVNTAYNAYSIGALSAISYVASVYIQKDSNTTRQAGFSINTSTQFSGALLNTATGVAQRSTDSTLTSTVSVSDAGSWWRLSMTWTGDATANNFRLTPAIAMINGTVVTAVATGSAVFASPQVEIGTTPTAYQATDASGISLDHPVNDAGLVLEGSATNLITYSQTFSDASWTKSDFTFTSNERGPDGVVGSGFRYTSSADGASISKTASNSSTQNITGSVWVKTASGVRNISIKVSGNVTAGSATTTAVGTNWTRISNTLSALSTDTTITLTIGGDLYGVIGIAIDFFGAQLELGTAATSYIPTTTTSASRLADVAGLVSPHNLLTYSDQFENAAWIKGSRVTVTANAEVGPDGIQAADRIVLANATNPTGTEDNLRLAVPRGTYESGKTYTLSAWIKVLSGSPTMRMFITDAGPPALSFVPTTEWRRFSLTYTATSSDGIGWTLDFNNAASVTYTVAIYGAQLTEGYLPGRYVRTGDTNVIPVSMIDPSWSQNGYIEFDLTDGANYLFGDGIGWPSSRQILLFYGATTTLQFNRYDSNSGGQSVSYSSFAVGESARVRLEWTNYVLSGSRYMFLRLYTNGILRQETNFAGRSGTSWPTLDATVLARMRSGANKSTISNLVIGTPDLPSGAIPAGI